MNQTERIEELEEHIYTICDIIHMELPLKVQDWWVKDMTERGLFDGSD